MLPTEVRTRHKNNQHENRNIFFIHRPLLFLTDHSVYYNLFNHISITERLPPEPLMCIDPGQMARLL